MLSALPACPALTDLTLEVQDFPDSFCEQLVKAVPRLRSLRFDFCSLLSLRFLRHTPNLRKLSLYACTELRCGHVLGVGSFAPQLECLRVEDCDPQLNQAEVRLLTPPGALGLPRLREFRYTGGTRH